MTGNTASTAGFARYATRDWPNFLPLAEVASIRHRLFRRHREVSSWDEAPKHPPLGIGLVGATLVVALLLGVRTFSPAPLVSSPNFGGLGVCAFPWVMLYFGGVPKAVKPPNSGWTMIGRYFVIDGGNISLEHLNVPKIFDT